MSGRILPTCTLERLHRPFPQPSVKTGPQAFHANLRSAERYHHGSNNAALAIARRTFPGSPHNCELDDVVHATRHNAVDVIGQSLKGLAVLPRIRGPRIDRSSTFSSRPREFSGAFWGHLVEGLHIGRKDCFGLQLGFLECYFAPVPDRIRTARAAGEF